MQTQDQTQNQNSHDCISSDRVEGTSVYGSDGEKIGRVDSIIIEKRSGQAREVIVDVGSFLGVGGTRHTIPWQKLEYDERAGGYKLDVTEEQLRNAPSHSESESSDKATDDYYRESIYRYYSVPIYW